MHLLIIEDEIPAFEKLRSMIAVQVKGSFTYDWARSVMEAKHFLSSAAEHSLIFSDIQLLDGNAFEIFDSIKVTIPIIFCSAYDAYLFKAFKSNGIEYILKPYTIDDITCAFTKYDTLFKSRADLFSIKVLDDLKSALRHSPDAYKKQFIIKTAKGIHIVETNTIVMVEAKGDFCNLITSNGKTHLYSQNIGGIYAMLNPKQFFRINRSQVVHLPFVESIENHFKNRLLLSLRGVSDPVKTSSATTADFRAWLDR